MNIKTFKLDIMAGKIAIYIYFIICYLISLLQTKCEIELVLRANNLVVNNNQSSSVILTDEIKREFDDFWERHRLHPLKGRNEILASFCPQIFGLYLVKLSVALTLIGGIQRLSKSGTRVRGESHLLLVGDPGNPPFLLYQYLSQYHRTTSCRHFVHGACFQPIK